jgi:hypothetical protein
VATVLATSAVDLLLVLSEAVLQLVDAENPPLRVFLGDGPLAIATRDYASRLAEWRAWESLSTAAHGTRG